jgi:hypothetical protein
MTDDQRPGPESAFTILAEGFSDISGRFPVGLVSGNEGLALSLCKSLRIQSSWLEFTASCWKDSTVEEIRAWIWMHSCAMRGEYGDDVEAVCRDATNMYKMVEESRDKRQREETANTNNRGMTADEIARLLRLLGDGAAVAILRTARDSTKTAEDRMITIIETDSRYEGFNSNQWAELLAVTAAAVRQTGFWKERKRRKEWAE